MSLTLRAARAVQLDILLFVALRNPSYSHSPASQTHAFTGFVRVFWTFCSASRTASPIHRLMAHFYP